MNRIAGSMCAAAALAAACIGFWPTAASAQDRMDLHKLADGVYMMQNSRGSSNAVFVVTDEGVLVFDADIRTADQVLAAIRKTTDKKVRYIITSHSAADHATGMWIYREDHPIYIATRTQMRDLYMQAGAEFTERKNSSRPSDANYKDAEIVLPNIAFEGAMTLRFGGLTFQLTEEGVAHSTSDVTVYIPQKRIFLAGDLLDTEIHPGQGESAEVFYSNVKNWIGVLDRIMTRRLPVDTYVPGHGPVHIGRGVADLQEQQRYFVIMRDEVSKMIAAGKTVEQVQAEFKLPAEFAKYQRPERLKSFLNLFYHQLLETGF
ncbi:MAG TPA: MBL fold metallo-hydrolase [Xanthobacteraceae bacterium]|nr:MBL fold metallo-hydrolase [Xanthobacteraceae bacterium]